MSEPVPVAMVDTSSTAREPYTTLRLAATVGQGTQRTHIRFEFVTDSTPAARNWVKGGGSVTALCNTAKAIWQQAEDNNTTYTVTSVEREQNQQADALSKEWADWYRIGEKTKARILHESTKRALTRLPVLNPPFGRRVPAWPAQQWWRTTVKSERIERGPQGTC
jgi:hypothetical protein